MLSSHPSRTGPRKGRCTWTEIRATTKSGTSSPPVGRATWPMMRRISPRTGVSLTDVPTEACRRDEPVCQWSS
jgi:hypothetical protein